MYDSAAARLLFAVLLAAVSLSYAGEPAPGGEEGDVDRLFHRGLNLLQNRSFEEAAGVFERILERRPDHVVARYCRGVCRLALGRYADSLEDFDAFLERKPGNPRGLGHRGQAYLGLGKYDKAVADLEKALEGEAGNASWTRLLEQATMLARGWKTSGVGDPFPEITLVAGAEGGEGVPWRVAKGRLLPLLASTDRVDRLLWGKPAFRGLILLFLPSADLPSDLAWLSEVSEFLPEAETRGMGVAAVAPSDPGLLHKVKEGKGLKFPLFSDPDGRAAWKLGILNVVFREIGRPLPTVFVIDADGSILLRRTALDAQRRTPFEKILKEIDRIYTRRAAAEAEKGKDGQGGGDGNGKAKGD